MYSYNNTTYSLSGLHDGYIKEVQTKYQIIVYTSV